MKLRLDIYDEADTQIAQVFFEDLEDRALADVTVERPEVIDILRAMLPILMATIDQEPDFIVPPGAGVDA